MIRLEIPFWHQIKLRAFRRPCSLALMGLALIMACAGCSRSKYIIPLQADAKSQFEYAAKLEKAYRSPLAKKTHTEKYNQALAGYKKVINNFPDDKQWPPRAELRIAMIHDTEGQKREALKAYERLIKAYPNDEDIQIFSLYGAAIIYNKSKDYDKAQACFLEITNRFSKTTNPVYKNIVRQSYSESQKTRKK